MHWAVMALNHTIAPCPMSCGDCPQLLLQSCYFCVLQLHQLLKLLYLHLQELQHKSRSFYNNNKRQIMCLMNLACSALALSHTYHTFIKCKQCVSANGFWRLEWCLTSFVCCSFSIASLAASVLWDLLLGVMTDNFAKPCITNKITPIVSQTQKVPSESAIACTWASRSPKRTWLQNLIWIWNWPYLSTLCQLEPPWRRI